MSDILGVQEIVDRLPQYFTVSCCSARNSGKSVLIQELVKALIKQKRVDIVLVMSGSAGLNDDFNFLPKDLVKTFNPALLETIRLKQIATPKEQRKHVLIVIDDALGTPEAFRNMTLQHIFTSGRHYYTSCIVCSQHSTYLLTPIIKGNSDIILWSRLGRAQLKTMWESTVNIDLKQFINISEAIGGKDYQFILFDNYGMCKAQDYTDFITYIKATITK